MATIYRDKRTSIFYVSHTRAGKRYREPLDTKDKAVAEQRLVTWLARRENDRWGDKPQAKFDELVVKFIDQFLPRKKPKTQQRYRVSLVALARHFEGVPLDDINNLSLSRYEAQRLETVADSTLLSDLRLLSKMFNLAIAKWGMARVNPVTGFLLATDLHVSEPRTRYLSQEEESLILDATRNHIMLHVGIAFAIDTGLRSDEQMHAEWSWVDIEHQQLTIPKKITKSGKARTVPLQLRTLALLQKLPRSASCAFIFWHEHKRRGRPGRYGALYKGFLDVASGLGITDVTWHDLRRTCGCRLLQDHNFSMEGVSVWLGHASIRTTESNYAFLDVRHLHRQLQDSPLLAKLRGSGAEASSQQKVITIVDDPA